LVKEGEGSRSEGANTLKDRSGWWLELFVVDDDEGNIDSRRMMTQRRDGKREGGVSKLIQPQAKGKPHTIPDK